MSSWWPGKPLPRPPSPPCPLPSRPRQRPTHAPSTASGRASAPGPLRGAPWASAWSRTAVTAARPVPGSVERPARRLTPAISTGACTATTAETDLEIVGVGCVLNGVRYKNGETFQPNCKYNCTCINGAVGCIPMCTNSRPPLVWCPNPKLIKMAGKCCEQWVCDDSRKIRKTSPRHISSAAYEGEEEAWQKNCIVHTSPWSPCSKTCGLGISTRISNDNEQCRLLKESRLCNMRPCEVDITQHIKPGKKCLAVYRANEPMNYTISGCVSKSPYRPKYCGVCTDNRCCTPYKSKTIEVRFQCPDGTEFSWKIMWINACFCNLNCRNPNDIFADLAHYHDYSEIAN
ncbi:WNT1-inducible-signaling pathway protein 1 isoform X2 [Empidonax traillii]|uniref:WNT1-inducible-signaling pathway protein 1 isoform X2 n=1 Tax=Empidonax traillii TaxID=164674 RepID=UPI000FFD2837|nr:WNT1-inducible-signaling pathway protein 1 isoform X2 [Empidonax traillii]